MKNLLFAIILLVSPISAIAQSVNKRLLTHTTPEGTLFFVFEKSLSNKSKDVKKFVYDVSFIETHDSVVINHTVVSTNRNDAAELCISNGDITAKAGKVEQLYHEIRGSKYEIRTSAHISYAEFKGLYSGSKPVEFKITRTDGTTYTATYSTSQWVKEKLFFDRVFYIINK